MKKALYKRKTIAVIALALLLLFSYLIYSRPMTLSQLHPLLPLDRCIGISGYYRTSEQTAGLTQFTLEAGSEEFQQLCTLFQEKTYRRSLKDLLPKGTRYHQTTNEELEFQWEVMFLFDTIEFPDGNGGSGSLLRVNYWYGELEIENMVWEKGRRSCYTGGQDAWAREILDVIC